MPGEARGAAAGSTVVDVGVEIAVVGQGRQMIGGLANRDGRLLGVSVGSDVGISVGGGMGVEDGSQAAEQIIAIRASRPTTGYHFVLFMNLATLQV